VPWRRLLLCAAIGGGAAVLLVTARNAWFPNSSVTAAKSAGQIWNTYFGPGEYQVLPPSGWAIFSGSSRRLKVFFEDFCLYPLMWVVVGAAMFTVYHRVALSGKARPPERARDGVLCGWCGYDVEGSQTGRCAECGHGFADRGSQKDRPPARRARPVLRNIALSVAWLIGCYISTQGISVLVLKQLLGWLPQTPLSAAMTGWLLIAFPTCVGGLLCYDLSARATAMFDGVARCGRCGAECDPASGCPRCAGVRPT
jgi:hypothetical protein